MTLENEAAGGEPFVLYPDTRKAVRRLNLRAVFVLIPILLCFWVGFGYLGVFLHALLRRSHAASQPLPSGVQAELTLIGLLPWFMTVFYVAIYCVVLVSLRRQRRPIVTLSSEGLVVHTLATQVGLIPWEEVAEVRVYTLLYRFVGIVPRDLGRLCRRMGPGGGLLLRANAWVIPLYRFFGVFVAPINIPQEYLPITADELAARIAQYRAAVPRRDVPGEWPPPPGVRAS